MTKPAVTKLFLAGVIAVVAGALLELLAVIATFAGGVIVVGGTNVVEVNGSSFAGILVFVVLVGAVAIIGGAIASLVSWIGALLNTARLEDKAWFVLLLLMGIFSLGFVAMLAYILIGPDGMDQQRRTDLPRPAGA